jgi:predicted peroxiredoxin
MRRSNLLMSVLVAVIALAAAAFGFQENQPGQGEPPPKIVVFNVTTGPEDVFRLTTAFRVAEDALDDGRRVILFFNGQGVRVPLKRLSPDLRLGDERALWVVLNDLIRRGAEILVARESVRELNMVEAEFLPETQFGRWGGKVFSKMDGEAVVFSY